MDVVRCPKRVRGEKAWVVKLALDENVDIVTVPLSVGTNLGSGLPDTSSSSTGANKVPTFSTSDYANNFPTITESMFNVSTV